MKRRFLSVLATTVLLALVGSAAALADGPTSGTGGRDDTAATQRAERKAERRAERRSEHLAKMCDRAEGALAKLQRKQAKLEQKIARIQEKLASGELTPEQQARAQAKLEKLQARLTKLLERIERLKTAIAEHCNGDDSTNTSTSSEAAHDDD